LTGAPDTADRFRDHKTIDGAWWLTLHDRCVTVTFSREISDRYDIPLLTYFTTEFDELLNEALGVDAAPVLACTRIAPPCVAAEVEPPVEQRNLLASEQTLLT
jgi:hypothetical protein